ncbi:hypothetical protein PR202_ga21344 [Eleusine coracana subsp. coracana]|uniref:FAS1 domain-containing protein n=1 Tax=Eleusine coracana subsp. coracana TaxID=191504 RepID=A0AAV5D0F1_ELECO|nr:hypothetical protein PR202_ga21344 [Eleusine coracana subsp. coracana]
MRRRSHLDATAALLLALLPLAAAATTGGKAPPPAAAKAKAPAVPPAPPNITALMAKGGCKSFASLVSALPDVHATFQSAVDGGVTAFCPTDAAVKSFVPDYKNLTGDEKASLLLFHAVPVYYSLRSLKSNNGVMNTLATDGGASNFNLTVQNRADEVTLRTAAVDAAVAVRDTVYDKDPVAIYAVDAVLEPVELFEPVEAPAPAPAPAPVADAPSAAAAGKKKGSHRHVADAPGPAADDDDAADEKKGSKKNAAAPAGGPCLRWLAAAVAVAAVLG